VPTPSPDPARDDAARPAGTAGIADVVYDADGNVLSFVTTGGGPPPHHVRDQEHIIAALPPCSLAPAGHEGLTPVALDIYPSIVWLPAPEAAELAKVPPGCVEWEWPDGASLLVMVARLPDYPGLHTLDRHADGACHAVLAGRPVAITRLARGAGADASHHAQVQGFLDDRTDLYAAVDAPSAERCDQLLAALLTLTARSRPDGPAR
jgi:hypothetical protein